jgi:hypothetical protein
VATCGSLIVGRWRIVETDLWDRGALDLVEPAHIRFGRGGLGEMRLIAIDASIDYRLDRRDGATLVEFSWAGRDERDATSGRAWARIDGDTMRGKLFIHQGDESAFVASREASVPRGSGIARAPDVYQFKVALLEVAPPVWRTIQVPGTYSFWDLHVAIQDAMGWLDYHLHAFRVRLPGTDATLQIGIPDEDAFEGDEPYLPGWEIPIARHFTRPGVAVRYEYDFGDGWEHEVTLEAVVPRQKGVRLPRCVAGERACPPEDCGGPPGYEHLIDVIGDPSHEEHESMLTWVGGRFDPERFYSRTVRFDDPRKRWALAFGKTTQSRRRGGRR